jgi:hypothetical protein
MRRAKQDLDMLGAVLTSDAPVPAFLPDESSQQLRDTHHDLRERTAKLETQVLAQYSAMAAYATIAKNDTDAARTELKHDLDRSQATVIGLVERVRAEFAEATAARSAEPDAVAERQTEERFAALEARFESLASALERSIQTQQVLAEQVSSLLAEKMQREGWLVSSGDANELTLR